MGTERVEAEPEGAERVEAEPEGAEPAAGRSVDQCLGPGWAFGGARHAPRAERAATLQPAPSDARVAPATTTHPLVALQQAAGNRAVADFVRARALAPRQVFAREPLDTPKGVTTASVDDAIKSGDPDKLKPLRPFPSLNLNQVRDISRLVIDKNWVVGPDDERTIELAWSALGGGASMAEADWRLWKECEDYGAELKAVPWLYEFRMTFAAKVRASALDSLDKNVVAIRAEAKRLGIGTRGEAAPAPTKESDDAVKEQAKLAQAVADAQARQKQLEDLEVGWDAPPSSDKSSAGGVQSTQQQKAKFNPHAPPHTPPRPEDGMADYQSVKANYDGMTRTIGSIVRQNPALYALTARDQMGTMKNADLAGARAELAAGLNGVLDDVAKTRANIESSSLGWQDLFPVQEKVLRGPEYQSAFNREAIEDAIKEAGGDAAAGAKLLSLVTLALITAVEVGTAGAATPVIAAVISLAASGASATMSWQEFSKLDTAAKATVSDDDAVVTKEQADGAKLAALMDTAIALIDVYGVGKAVTAARPGAKATVAALEGRVKNAATLRSELGKIGRGETVEGAEAVVKESVEAMGAAATVRSAGGWAALEKAVGANGTKEVGAWRDEVIPPGGGGRAAGGEGRGVGGGAPGDGAGAQASRRRPSRKRSTSSSRSFGPDGCRGGRGGRRRRPGGDPRRADGRRGVRRVRAFRPNGHRREARPAPGHARAADRHGPGDARASVADDLGLIRDDHPPGGWLGLLPGPGPSADDRHRRQAQRRHERPSRASGTRPPAWHRAAVPRQQRAEAADAILAGARPVEDQLQIEFLGAGVRVAGPPAAGVDPL